MPVYVGLRTVLARYLPPQPGCNEDVKEEEEEEEEVGEEEVELELQELDKDLDKEDDKDKNTKLVNPTIKQEPREPLEEEEGFQTASRHIVRPTRGAVEAPIAARVTQSAKATKASKLNQRT